MKIRDYSLLIGRNKSNNNIIWENLQMKYINDNIINFKEIFGLNNNIIIEIYKWMLQIQLCKIHRIINKDRFKNSILNKYFTMTIKTRNH